MGCSIVQKSPSMGVCVYVYMSLSVIECNDHPIHLHLQWIGRRGRTTINQLFRNLLGGEDM
jgi:hypothetical protein